MLELLEGYWQEVQDPKDLLLNLRRKSWDHFLELGWPRPKQEAFQYLPLQKIHFPKLAKPKKLDIFQHPLLPGCEGHLVFVDGFFDETLSKVPSSLICLPLDAAMRSYGLFIQNRIARTLKEEKDPFAALNRAMQGRGAFLYAPPKYAGVKPIQILQISTSEEMAMPRLEIVVGKGAKLELVQTAWFQGKSNSICNSAADAVLEEGAELSFCDAQLLPKTAIQFQSFRATLKRDSRLTMRSFTHGAAMVRHSLKVQLAEENAEALLQGLSRLDHEAQGHVHAIVEHLAPHTRSRQHFKSVLKGKSRYSFEGKILVRPIAQKTEAYQLNNNLVLSDEASANAKPNLEIFADDVKASHGATIGQLDPEQMFYLRSRGLELEEATQLLVDGFCKELIEQAPACLKEVLYA